MTIVLNESQIYYFSPQDFGFPLGATFEDYSSYYVQIVSSQPNQGNEINLFFEGREWNYYRFPEIWFPDISRWGLKASVNGSDTIYSLNYKVYQRTNIPIVMPESMSTGYPVPFPSQINVNFGEFVPTSVLVSLSNLTHLRLSDLNILIANPAGRLACLLFYDMGYFSYTSQSFTYADTGISMGSLALGSTLNGLTFRPKTASEVGSYNIDFEFANWGTVFETFHSTLGDLLAGGSIEGAWRLYVIDRSNNNGGLLDSWSLTFQNTSGDTLTYTPSTIPGEVVGPLQSLYYSVIEVNNLPVQEILSVGQEAQCYSGLQKQIMASLSDVDSNNAVTTITATDGTLSAISSYYNYNVANNGTSSITITESIGNIDYIMQYCLMFTAPSPGGSSVDITFHTVDEDGGEVTSVLTMQILNPLLPVGLPFSIFMVEPGQASIDPEAFALVNTDDPYEYGLKSITVSKLPEKGVLKINGTEVEQGQLITIEELEDSELIFENLTPPAFDETYTFEYFVESDLDPIYGGSRISANPVIVTIFSYAAVILEGSEPALVTLAEKEEIPIDFSTFGYSSLETFQYNFESFEILSLPTSGSLMLGSAEVFVGDIIPVIAEPLVFLAPENVTNYSLTSLSVRLRNNPERSIINIQDSSQGSVFLGYEYPNRMVARPFPSAIYINGSMANIENLTITLLGLEYAGMMDVRGQVVSPSGDGCLLFYQNIFDNYDSSTDIKTITFDDDAANTLQELSRDYIQTTPSGSYKPSPGASPSGYSVISLPYGGSMSPTLEGLTNSSPIGKWKLYLIGAGYQDTYDWWSSDGALESWRINFSAIRSGFLTLDATVFIGLEPEDDAPRLISFTVIECKKELETPISGLSLIDPDGYSPTVSILAECSNGIIRIEDYDQLTVTGNSSESITITGNYLNIKSKIELQNNLFYTGNQDFTGNDIIEFTVTSQVPNSPTESAVRYSKATVIVRENRIVNSPLLAPTYVSHGQATDTAVAIHWNDPRTDGSYWLNGELVSSPPRPVPDFEGQLVCYLTYPVDKYVVSLLCGHDDGTGLQWYEVATNGASLDVLIDTRTGKEWDPYWSTNCNPPWICG